MTGRYASRAVNLTELYPSDDVAFIRWNTRFEGGEQTIAPILSQAGYRTAIAGKYHNIENEFSNKQIPINPDEDARDPDVIRRLQHNHDTLTGLIQNYTGFDEVINIYANNLHTLDLPDELHEHNPEWITDGAIQFMRRNQDKPFFIKVAYTIPHGPNNIKSMRSDPRATLRGYLDEAPQVQPSRESVFERVEEVGLPESRANLTWLDDAVGALLGELEQLGLRENTFIIFASDHSLFGKMTCYERGVNTPGIVSWPGKILQGHKTEALTANIDWVPTILAATGVEPPDDYIIDGKNIMPLLKGEIQSVRDHLLLEVVYTKGVVTQDWKYIATRFPNKLQGVVTPENRHEYNQEGERFSNNILAGVTRSLYNIDEKYPGYYDDDQLYNLKTDPSEMNNLSANPEEKDILEQMKSYLNDFQSDKPHRFGEFGDSNL
jgi:arylsulfatase A-like enzyme